MAPTQSLLDSKPQSAPLYRYVVETTTDTTKYLIAYRAVTLLPFPDTRKDDNSTPNADIPTDPVPGTVGIRLGETGPTSNTIVTKNVQIHAEDIYIYAGSYFSLREKNLTISANRIFAVPAANGKGDGQIEFDCSGVLGAPYTEAAKDGPDAPECPAPGQSVEFDLNTDNAWAGQPGKPGDAGLAGRKGGDGGTITVVGRLLALQGESCSLVLNVLGGAGGPGQDGGRGGRGATIVEGDWHTRLLQKENIQVNDKPWNDLMNGLNTHFDGPPDRTLGPANMALPRIEDMFSSIVQSIALGANLPPEAGRYLVFSESAGGFGGWVPRDPEPIIVSAYIVLDSPSRFYPLGGQGGFGGEAGQPGRSGTVQAVLSPSTRSTTSSATSAGSFSISEPAPISVSVAGGQRGVNGALGTTTAPSLVADIQLTADWGYPDLLQKTIQGLNVQMTNNGNAITAGDPISSAIAQDKALNVKYPGMFRDPTQLVMVLQRVRFEYQMGFGAQPYADLGLDSGASQRGGVGQTRSAKDASDLNESIGWLQQCVGELGDLKSVLSWTAPPQQDVFVRGASQFVYNLTTMSDIFGNSVSLVINPAVSLSDAENEIKSLQALEDASNTLAAELSDEKAALAKQSQTSQSLNNAVQKSTRNRAQLLKQMADTYDAYGKSRLALIAMRSLLVGQMNQFWDSVKGDFEYHGNSCGGWSNVMSSVGSALMFAGTAEVKPAMAAGGALQVGASIWGAVDQMDEADREEAATNLKRDAIETRIHRIGDALDVLKVSDFMKTVREDDPSISDPSAADNLQSVIMVEKNKLTELCDRYFQNYIKSDDIKDNFDVFLDQAQTLRTTMQTYTKLATQYLQVIQDGKVAADSIATLDATAPTSVANPSLDLVFQFYVRTVSEQFAAALSTLYEGVRAYNCMTMTRSSALGKLAELGSWDSITGAELSAALDVLRNEILDYFRRESSSPLVHFPEGQSFSITADSHPSIFKGFMARRSLTLYLQPEDGEKYGLQPDWYDVRLGGARVHLIGAKRKAGGSIFVRVTVGPRFHLLDEGDKGFEQHTFDFPAARTTTVSYAAEADGTFKETSSSAPVYESNFSFEIAGQAPENIPLATPFTAWKLSVDASVDLSALTAVEIELDVYARTSNGFTLDDSASGAAGSSNKGAFFDDAGASDATRPAGIPRWRGVPKTATTKAQTAAVSRAVVFKVESAFKNAASLDAAAASDAVAVSEVLGTPKAARALPHAVARLAMGFRVPWTWTRVVRRYRVLLRNNQPFRTSQTPLSTALMKGLTYFFSPPVTPIQVPLRADFFRPLRRAGANTAKTTAAMLERENQQLSRDIITQMSMAAHETLVATQGQLQAPGGPGLKLGQEIHTSGFRFQGGHEAFTGGIVSVPQDLIDAAVKDPAKALGAHLQAFPGMNVIFFNMDDSNEMSNSHDLPGWVQSHPDSLERATKDGSGLQVGTIVALTPSSYVQVRDIFVQKVPNPAGGPDRIVMSVPVATTSTHQFSGINWWSTIIDPAIKGQVTQTNTMIGSTRMRPFDFINASRGTQLMGGSRTAFPYSLAAQRAGEDVNAYIQRVAPDHWDLRHRFFLSETVGKLAALVRNVFGGNVEEDVTIYDFTERVRRAQELDDPGVLNVGDVSDVTTLPSSGEKGGSGFFLTTDENPDVAVPILSVGAVAVDFANDPPVPIEELRAAQAAVRSVMGDVDLSGTVKKPLMDTATQHATSVAADLKADGFVPTTDAVSDRLMQRPVYTEPALSSVLGSFLTADTVDFLRDSAGLSSITGDGAVREAIAQVAMQTAVTDASGVTGVWQDEAVATAVGTALQSTDLDKAVVDALDQMQSLDAALQKLVDARKAVEGAAAAQLDRQIADAKDKLEEAQHRQEQLDADAKQASDFNSSEAEEQRNKDLNDREQAELNHWKERQSGERPPEPGPEPGE